MTQRPFRFAVQAFSAESGDAWREKARQAEGRGYSALHLADHVIGPGPAIERHAAVPRSASVVMAFSQKPSSPMYAKNAPE